MSYLIRTTAIIEDCEEGMMSLSITGTPIESYLVQHALVVLCAEVQQEVYKIVQQRAAASADRQVASFVNITAQKVLRSVKKSELAGFVGYFGQVEKERFNDLLSDSDITRYSNAVRNRHEVAHRSGVQITFAELKQAVIAAQNILKAIADSIEYHQSDSNSE